MKEKNFKGKKNLKKKIFIKKNFIEREAKEIESSLVKNNLDNKSDKLNDELKIKICNNNKNDNYDEKLITIEEGNAEKQKNINRKLFNQMQFLKINKMKWKRKNIKIYDKIENNERIASITKKKINES